MPTCSQIRFRYLKNNYNTYVTTGADPVDVVTGWQRIPNNRLFHYLDPKEWQKIVYTSKAFRVKSLSVKVMNMIPITTNVALNQNATLTTFNNTIYAMAYDDKTLTSRWQLDDEEEHVSYKNLWTREGIKVKADGTVDGKMFLPPYSHKQVCRGDCSFWDPLSDATNIKELRPGKNAVEFHWENKRPGPTLKFYGSGQHTGPYTATTPPFQTNDLDSVFSTGTKAPPDATYQTMISEGGSKIQHWTRSNYTSLGRDQASNWRNPANQREDDDPLGFIETHNVRHDIDDPDPLPNWFMKLVPLFDDSNALISGEAQVLIQWTMEYETTPRVNLLTHVVPDWADPFSVAQYYSGEIVGRLGVNVPFQIPTWTDTPGDTYFTTQAARFKYTNQRECLITTAPLTEPTTTTTTTGTNTKQAITTTSSSKRPKVSFQHDV